MFSIGILLILIIIVLYIRFNKKYIFENYNNDYPFNPPIQTPQSNYLDITKKLEDQDKYKSDLSVGLSPTPTIQCGKLQSKSDCNDNGCNWFGTFCSAMYPSYL
jgi:hypothetical protein